MRLVTFEVSTAVGPVERIGALTEAGIVDLVAAYGARIANRMPGRRADALARAIVGATMIEFFEGGSESRAVADEALDHAAGLDEGSTGPTGSRILYGADDIRLLAPVPKPPALRDYTGFREHMEAFLKSIQMPDFSEQIFRARPMYYKANRNMVVGPGEVVPWPTVGEKLDFEVEPAIFIGKAGQNVRPEAASDHIAGYTILNDFSIRDYQEDEMSLPVNLYGVSKSKDAARYAIGPCVVTPDELEVSDLDLIVRVNGEEWVRETTRDMTWTFADIVSYSSLDEPLVVGECMAGGAPPRGCGADIGRWVQPGDEIECEIEGIGVLRNVLGQRSADSSLVKLWHGDAAAATS
jgi:2-keto-4-pentenoate hydratase/2-oxohepta-3-ene-1,7-dioic acid hydratase in catechol pathway